MVYHGAHADRTLGESQAVTPEEASPESPAFVAVGHFEAELECPTSDRFKLEMNSICPRPGFHGHHSDILEMI
jgi:hypothetical protein